MQNLESIENISEKSKELLLQLNHQIALENVQNLKMVIENIASYFDKGLVSTTTDRKACIEKIENYESYLGKKYCDTVRERTYIKTVKEAILYLKSL